VNQLNAAHQRPLRLLLFNLAVDADDAALGFVVEWVKMLAERCEYVDVITMRAGDYDLPENVRVFSVGKEHGVGEARRALAFYRILWRLLQERAYDVCFAHMMPLFAIMGAPLLKLNHIPITLWYVHKSVTLKLRLAEMLVDQVVTASPESFRLDSDKVKVLGHGVNTDVFTPAAPSDDGRFVIVSVGRIARSKRLEHLIAAAGTLAGTGLRDHMRVRIVGEAEPDQADYAEWLQELVEQHGLSDIVEFTGGMRHEDIAEVYRGADVMVNFSNTGSIDKAVLEAMSCAIPVLTSNEAFEPILRRWKDTLLVSVDDEDEFPGLSVGSQLAMLANWTASQRIALGWELRGIVVEGHSLTGLMDRLVALFKTQVRHTGRETVDTTFVVRGTGDKVQGSRFKVRDIRPTAADTARKVGTQDAAPLPVTTQNLLYVANIRVPTEKAHGLQIMQNCEAFAQNGADVTLWAAGRFNTPELRAFDSDPFAYYGVERRFELRRLPCIDLLPLVPGRNDLPGKLAFYLQAATFMLSMFVASLFNKADIYYSRDALALFLLSLVKPRHKLVYEAHKFAPTMRGSWLQHQAIGRAGTVITVTERLADDLALLSGDSSSFRDKLLVAHDGIRRERFEDMPTKEQARLQVGWPADAFIVGYVGRLHTLSMDKGVGTLVDALAQVENAVLAVVGGPDDMAEALYQQWRARGMSQSRFLYTGHVAPDKVPVYLSAFDVCAMPFPFTEHFAYYASPIKLFEYMASQRAIVASDLPALAEVLVDGESALLVEPGNADELAAAIERLRLDPSLGEWLAACAYGQVMGHYTWEARAAGILGKVQRTEYGVQSAE